MIYERQYSKILAQELLKYLLLGRLPNVSEIGRKLAAALKKDGNTIYQYVPHPAKTVFQHRLYNKSLKQIKFDIDVFQEELLDLFQDSVKRVNYADLYQRVHNYELSELEAKLRAILFTIQNADFYFLSAFDNFTDSKKTDQVNTTPNLLNLAEKCLSLPYGGRGTQRVRMAHMARAGLWQIDVVTPTTGILSKREVPGTQFSDMFIDTTSSWAYEVVTESPSPVQITFKFPVAGYSTQEVEVFLNRIELVNHSGGVQKAVIRLSNDDVNYLTPTGYEQGVTLRDQRIVVAMDFETTLTQFVEVTLTKETPDAEVLVNGTKGYQYILGLRSFAAFITGRIIKGVYQSKPFDFSGDAAQVTAVSIDSEYEKPQGTSINYSIALSDDSGSPLTQFLPLRPIGRDVGSSTPEVVVFNKNTTSSRRFNVQLTGPDAAIAYGEAFQGRQFYRIGPTLNPMPIFGSVKLFRGYASWYRDSSRGFQLQNVSDVFVPFDIRDSEGLYNVTTEMIGPGQYTYTPSSHTTLVSLSKPPYYNSDLSHQLRPQILRSTESDLTPRYAIYKVLQTNPERTRTLQFAMLDNVTTAQYLPAFNFLIQTANENERPVLRSLTNGIYQAGVDFTFGTTNVDGVPKPNGTITVLSTGRLYNPNGGSQTFTFTFTYDPDITHKVTAISSSDVTLSNAVVLPGDSLQVTYRYLPRAPNEIVKSSVRVYNAPSSSSRTPYVEGRDYVVDPINCSISRLPTGSIPLEGYVYVDYTFRNAEEGIETFQTWCFIPDTEGSQIKFELGASSRANALTADTTVGEAFMVATSQGLVDITRAVATPRIGPGWVQFIVRSKNPDTNISFGSNLIDQIIQLRDNIRRRVFKPNSTYFSDIVAFRDPMVQRTINHLKVNTLRTDHESFAVDDFTDTSTAYLVVNYLPGSTPELYCRVPSGDNDVDARPDAVGEEFSVEWESRTDTGTLNRVIVKIELERADGIDGAMTPKVFGYKLRVAY